MNAISGRKRGELFLKWDRSTASWRTCQTSLLEMDETGQHMGEPFLETLPKWATISNMELRVLPMPEPPISGNGSGSWPTPTATERSGTNPNTGRGAGLWKEVKQWPTPRAIYGEHPGMTDPRHLTGAVQRQYPTPSAQEPGWKNIELVDGHGCSPPCHPNQRFYDKNTGRLVQKGLQQVVQRPTPTTRDHKDGTAQSCANVPDNGLLGRVIHTADAPDNSGVLSPDWTTWLMGLPQNWVTLEPVSEESFAEWETRMADGSWWEDEHDLPRTVPSRKGRVNMLKALGNGIVPRTIPTFLNYARSN